MKEILEAIVAAAQQKMFGVVQNLTLAAETGKIAVAREKIAVFGERTTAG